MRELSISVDLDGLRVRLRAMTDNELLCSARWTRSSTRSRTTVTENRRCRRSRFSWTRRGRSGDDGSRLESRPVSAHAESI